MLLSIRSSLLTRMQTGPRPGWLVFAFALAIFGSGCAAITNPVAEGIPVRRLPAEYLAKPKEEARTIPLTLLRQPQPDAYRVDAEDTLGIFIEGVLGKVGELPPLRLPEQGNLPPAIGFPVVVTEEGKLPLRHIKPLLVKGMTIPEVRNAIIKAYTVDQKILATDPKTGEIVAQVLVSLMRPRSIRVQVNRQDTGAISVGSGSVTNSKRGSGASVDLPAYENDVLTAINRTGGLPGLDAVNEILIQRNDPRAGGDPAAPPQVIRIPLRMRDGEVVPFQPADVILKKGDVVFIEARDTEVYYTAGLLSPHQFVLPRDYDLRVVDAIAIAGGPVLNGGIQQNNLSGNIITSGLGSPSPSRVTVLRRTKGNGQVPIIVDLNRALIDPRENIIMAPGDVLVMQETPGEATTRYLTTILRYNIVWDFLNQKNLLGTGNASGP
jgi:protein involved in polysaccharide export with SLBB domain